MLSSITFSTIIKQGDLVPVTVTVTNISGSAVTIAALHITIRRNFVEVYRTASGTLLPESVTLPPGETKTVATSWNTKDNNGNTVAPGNYELIGSCIGSSEAADLLVDIIVQ